MKLRGEDMDARDKAIIVSQEISTNYARVRVGDDISGMQKMIQDAIEAAERDAYNRAIEDAARIARSHVRKFNGLQIADAIRALKKA